MHGVLSHYGDIKHFKEGVDATKCALKVDQNTGMEKFEMRKSTKFKVRECV